MHMVDNLAAMGLDITVLIADCSWLAEVPPERRVARLWEAWEADETGLWDWDDDASAVEYGWVWPKGPDSDHFAVYEFLHTTGSFKAHFWLGNRWESARDHVDPALRAELDALLAGLIWMGMDGEVEHTDTGFFGGGEGDGEGDRDGGSRRHYSVLLARSPDTVRELVATWNRVRPQLGQIQVAFTEHAAVPDGWIRDFGEFVDLLTEWGEILTEAARRGWGIAGFPE